jgi:hypothetical protein
MVGATVALLAERLTMIILPSTITKIITESFSSHTKNIKYWNQVT